MPRRICLIYSLQCPRSLGCNNPAGLCLPCLSGVLGYRGFRGLAALVLRLPYHLRFSEFQVFKAENAGFWGYCRQNKLLLRCFLHPFCDKGYNVALRQACHFSCRMGQEGLSVAFFAALLLHPIVQWASRLLIIPLVGGP